jgi:phosphoribosylformylglycinamidine cyclo-ligase
VDDAAARRFVERIRPLAASTHRPEVLAGVGPFAGLFRLGTYHNPVLVSSTDNVGTKVKIAALLGKHRTLGIDLVNQSVNDILTVGAEPLFFLDYIGSSSLAEDEKVALVEGIACACREAGCALIGGETATLPDLYPPGEFDFVGFIVGVVERDAMIDGSTIRAGDALLALPSSGLHTNGYSLARRAFGVAIGGDPADERARLEREYEELGMSLGEALLAPHRCYLHELRPLLPKTKGIAHITGGGAIIENLARALPDGLGARIDGSAWEVPPLFRSIQREGNVPEDEMWRTFNMGLGVIFAVDPSDVEMARSLLPEALLVGAVVQAQGDERVRVQ